MQDNKGSVQIMGGKEVQFKGKTEKLSERRFSMANAQRRPEDGRKIL